MSTTSFRVRGRHVLAALLGFFAAIIAINVAFAIAAVRSFPGEDERRSYTQGLRYNEVLAERRAQAALGWQAQPRIASTPSGARLMLRLTDRAGEPIEGANVSGVLRWAPHESGDRALSFIAQGNGIYAADLAALAPGRWVLRAHAEDQGGGALDLEAELVWSSTP